MEAGMLHPTTVRPEVMNQITYSAWKLWANGQSYPLNVGDDATTLDEVVDRAAPRCHHKDVFHILQHDQSTGKSLLHIYVVKQGKATWQKKPGYAHPVQFKPLKAVLIAVMQIGDFRPVEPFVWTPGCDVIGANEVLRSTVEVAK